MIGPVWRRLRAWLRRDQLSAELDEELRFHQELLARDQRAAGVAADEAHYAARRRLGNRTALAEEVRALWSLRWLDDLMQDVRYAARSLRRTPLFTAVAVLTLALGVGANTAVFSVVNGVLLRPLPFREPGRLLLLSYQDRVAPNWAVPGLLDRHYEVVRRGTRSFESIATFNGGQATLTGAGDPTRLTVARVGPGFFTVLGSQPAEGRLFGPADGEGGGAQVAILSDGLWRTRFAADRSILGRTISLDGIAHVVVGVMPATFSFPTGAALWIPADLRISPNLATMRPVMGRLRPGVSPAQAQAELESLSRSFELSPDEQRDQMAASVLPLNTLLIRNIERSLLILAGAVAFVLLIACANVANLLLMRGATRAQEVAVRTALGAGRPRLVRQLLTESLVLFLTGAAAGVPVALAGTRALLALAPPGTFPRLHEIRLDVGVLLFTFGVALVTGLVFGLAPALLATRRAAPLPPGHGARTTPGRLTLRSTLVVAEIALALVLLTGAGLMIRSFQRLRAIDLGFQPVHVMSMTVDLPDTRYPSPDLMRAFHARVVESLARLPRTAAAGAVNWRPLGDAQIEGTFSVEGQPPPHYNVSKPAVSPDYFRAIGIRVVHGRSFTAQEDARAPGVAIVSRSVAARHWPGADPLGKRISMQDHPAPTDWLTVVGVVEDVRQERLTQDPMPAIYRPVDQVSHRFFLGHMTFIARTDAPAGEYARAMRNVLREIDPDLPAQALAPFQELVAQHRAEPQFQTRILAAFSLLALALAAVGIYGLLAYSVVERTREIGIRMALGAPVGRVLRQVLLRTLLLAGAGVAVGAGGALATTRVMTKLLFDTSPTDPATFAAVATLLIAVGVAAGLIPARRASRVDPVQALRAD
ncbi:MAG TPA: ABC transporter permease [Gemmatimonadales bacterium]|nr:ABC transporter permease [Gemmatimonadales bacterium]